MTERTHYELLEVAADADDDAVRAAVARQRRVWQPRTGHPRLETRQRAEQVMAQLSDAEGTLLDASARADYDRGLVASPGPPGSGTASVPVPETASGPDPAPVPRRRTPEEWGDISYAYLEAGEHVQASGAAREAVALDVDYAYGWYLRGEASRGLGDHHAAVFELSEAARLEPGDPDYRAVLGDLHAERQDWAEAVPHYRRALDLGPDDLHVRSMLGAALTWLGDDEEGVTLLSEANTEAPEDDAIANRYAEGLVKSTVVRWSTDASGDPLILSRAQLDDARLRLATIDLLPLTDPGVLESVAAVRREIAAASRVRVQSWRGFGKVVAFELFMLVLVGPVLGLFGGDVTGPRTVGVALMVLVPLVFFLRRTVPTWRWRRRRAPRGVRASGL